MAYSEDEIKKIADDMRYFATERFNTGVPVTLSRFCVTRRVSRTTIYKWDEIGVKVISDALSFLRECQRGDLIEGGLEKRYDNKTSTLLLKSNHGMTDRTTFQGNGERPLEVNYKHDPAKAAEEIIAAHGESSE